MFQLSLLFHLTLFHMSFDPKDVLQSLLLTEQKLALLPQYKKAL